MDGRAGGIDYASALAMIPAEFDRAEFSFLLRQAEAGLLAGLAKLES